MVGLLEDWLASRLTGSLTAAQILLSRTKLNQYKYFDDYQSHTTISCLPSTLLCLEFQIGKFVLRSNGEKNSRLQSCAEWRPEHLPSLPSDSKLE